ncbi:MAG: leucine-rich repeat domain-containing protein, partial [Ruminococcus sp.]
MKKKWRKCTAGVCAFLTAVSCLTASTHVPIQAISVQDIMGQIGSSSEKPETASGSSITETTTKTGAVAVDDSAVRIYSADGSGAEIDWSSLFEYDTTDDETAVICGLSTEGYAQVEDGSLTSLEIPSEIDGLTVTEIGGDAFWECSWLESVTIPETVTTIGACAFQGSGLKIIDLPESVTFIGASAFKECDNMTDAYVRYPNCKIESDKQGRADYDENGYGGYYDAHYTFPPNITIHGYENSTAQYYAERYSWYYGDDFMGNYTFSADWKTVSDGLKYDIQTDGTLLITGHEEAETVTEIIIPEEISGKKVTGIEEYAFSRCSALVSVTIPETVTEIGYGAFYGCSSLTDITIPETVTEIKDEVFSGCSSLTSVTIPETVTTIGECAFQGSGLEIIDLPESVAFIGAGAFKECNNMTDAYVRNPNCEIESYKEGQEYVVITTTTTMPMYYEVDTKLYGSSYGYGGYYDAYYTFPPNITIHGYKNSTAQDYADEYSYWEYSDNKGGYTFVADLKHVYNGLEYDIQSNGTILITGHEETETVTEIIIPEEISGKKVTGIGANAFSGCSALASVTIPETVTSIGINAFSDCTSLESIVIPESVTNLGKGMFSGCTALTDVTLPDTLTGIPENYFQNCTSLSTIALPDSVTSIDTSAFCGCTSLSKITLPDGLESIGTSAFSDCTSLTEITLPSSVKWISSYAFSGCTALSDIKLSSSLKGIYDGAFSGCTALTEIVIPESVEELRDAFVDCENLEKITISNPSCKLVTEFAPETTIICGSISSTAHRFANQYDL